MIHSSIGFADERIYLFRCRAVRQGGPEEEGVEVLAMPMEEALRAVRDGRITDAKTVAALLLAADRRR